MILRTVKTAVVLLLGFALGCQGVFTVSADGGARAAATKRSCCCTGCDFTRCATPACCGRPGDDHNPCPPVPPPTPTQNERQALAASVSSWLTLPLFSPDELPSCAPSPAPATGIPLFQWDCSYL